ncbi:MAG TPA: nitrate reductase [Acidimicrobiales bacterium]|nr:nitrate reductase [Acidimicrobiales bacterium]
MRLLDRLRSLLHQDDGPLTADLSRRPGGFGIGQVPARRAPDATTSMICGFCSTGCSLDVHLRDGQAVGLTPSTHHPVNLGMACPKGWEALTPLSGQGRATTPLLRGPGGRLEPVSWEVATTTFARRFQQIQADHGLDSVAFLGTGQMPSEELALLGAVAKIGMGMVHGDGNTRQCMASSVVAYKECFGFDAPPYTYADLEASDVIVLVGSNLCIAHPILWERITRNPHHPEIIVIDPRVTETAMAATTHLPLLPKSDLMLLYGVARLIIERGWVDEAFVAAHTEGYDAWAAAVADFTVERVGAATGLSVEQLEGLARSIGTGERVSLWWTMGVNQGHEAVRTAQAIIGLALMTGNIGRPGTGPNSITGQCNAMGSRLFANTTNLFGGRSFTDAGDRAEVASILDVPVERIPDRPSWAYDQIVEGIASGAIRGLWVIATNPAHSWISSTDLDGLLDRLDLLVVQDMYATTETARRADLVLPAAAWGEKEGTFINSERRLGVIKAVSLAPGQALADFAILRLLADAWGCGELFERWTSPEAAFAILQELSAGRPCDISGIDGYRHIDDAGGIQWPCPAGAEVVAGDERRLFADGRFLHPDGRAHFVADVPRAPREAVSDRFPLVLLTGRGSAAQWHTGTRTSTSAVLRSLAPEGAWVEVNPVDAEVAGVSPGDEVEVASARGTMRARALVTATVSPGQVFVAMHDAATNRLTHPTVDPHSRQPSYKHAAVAVRALAHWER